MRRGLVWLAVGVLAASVWACGGGGDGGNTFGGDDGGGSSGSGSSSGGSSGSGSSSGAGSSSGGSSGAGSGSGGSSGAGSSSGGSSGSSSGSASGGGLQFTSSVSIIVEPSDDASALISAIQNAKTSVHMTMYLLSNTKVIDALIAQHQAGHDVKVLLNETFPSSGSNSGSNSGVYAQLQSALGAANVKYAPGSGSFYTHEKGVMIDGKTAWIMTMNATQSSPTANREYLAVDTDPDDVTEAEAIFQADFANQSIVPKGKLVVAPINAHLELTGLIGMAKSTVDMEAEELSDAQILASLEAAGDRGVKVHVVLADTASTTAAAALKQHGVQLVTFSGYYVHAKSIVVDGAYAYVGSENFSGGSLGYNRELGVLTNTASEVAKVETTTQKDFAGGTAL